jgi:urease accessory protein
MRSQGSLDLCFSTRRGRSHVRRSYQSGCLRMRQPKPDHGDIGPCAILINTSGGLADGDRLEQHLRWDAGSAATVTTQAAEKVYRALSSGSVIDTRIEVADGAHAEWLPQETILFDKARLHREARIMLADGVSFLGLEAVVFGRAAMGERMRGGALRDRLRIYRNGRLIYADALEIAGDVEALMRKSAVANGAGAMAVLVHASSEAASLLPAVRDALGSARGRAAASSWNGLLAVRLLAPDGASLRHDIIAALSVLRGGRALPRVWRC